MSTDAPPTDTPKTAVVAAQPPRQRLIVQDNSANAHLFDTAKFEQCWRIAEAMAIAELLPDHLRLDRAKKALEPKRIAGNCLLVVNQAIRWGMDPFAVAPETYSVGGKLAYQGKLVAAVVNSRAGLRSRLSYEFSGSGDARMVRVTGWFDDEDAPRIVELTVCQAKTDNKMWRTDPDQKLVYSAATKWARRHCPEVILGVLTDDEADRMAAEATPRIQQPTNLDSLADKLIGQSQETPPDDVGQTANSEVQSDESDVRKEFAECIWKMTEASSQIEVNKMEARAKELAIDDGMTEEAVATAAQAIARIKGGRGEKANKKDLPPTLLPDANEPPADVLAAMEAEGIR